MICISHKDLVELMFLWAIRLSLYFCERYNTWSVKDLIEYMFLWTIWLCLYFCKRSDHMICISVNSLSPYYCIQEICVERSVFFVKDLITGSLFLSTIRISPHFCQRFYHMYSRLNYLITTIFCERFNHLSILWPMSLHHHFAKHVWLQVYFRDRFDYIFLYFLFFYFL